MVRSVVVASALLLFVNGCMIRHSSPARHAGKSCPPGHVWSDGDCHDKGKGHDPAKHKKKKKKDRGSQGAAGES